MLIGWPTKIAKMNWSIQKSWLPGGVVSFLQNFKISSEIDGQNWKQFDKNFYIKLLK